MITIIPIFKLIVFLNLSQVNVSSGCFVMCPDHSRENVFGNGFGNSYKLKLTDGIADIWREMNSLTTDIISDNDLFIFLLLSDKSQFFSLLMI